MCIQLNTTTNSKSFLMLADLHEVYISLIYAPSIVLNINTRSADCCLDVFSSDIGDHLFCPRFFLLLVSQTSLPTHTYSHTHEHRDVVNSLGLYVSLLSYSVGDLLAVVVFFLGFDQLFYRLLELGLNAAQLIYGLWKGKRKRRKST